MTAVQAGGQPAECRGQETSAVIKLYRQIGLRGAHALCPCTRFYRVDPPSRQRLLS